MSEPFEFIRNYPNTKKIDKNLYIDDETESTSTITGALITNGGMGIKKDICIGGNLTIDNTISGNDINLNGTIIFNGITYPSEDGNANNYIKINSSGVLSFDVLSDIDFVHGPTSSTNNAIVRYDGNSGNFIKNSNVLIDDSNNITGVLNLNGTSINSTTANITTVTSPTISPDNILITGNTVSTSTGGLVLASDSGTITVNKDINVNNSPFISSTGTISFLKNILVNSTNTNINGILNANTLTVNSTSTVSAIDYGSIPLGDPTNGIFTVITVNLNITFPSTNYKLITNITNTSYKANYFFDTKTDSFTTNSFRIVVRNVGPSPTTWTAADNFILSYIAIL